MKYIFSFIGFLFFNQVALSNASKFKMVNSRSFIPMGKSNREIINIEKSYIFPDGGYVVSGNFVSKMAGIVNSSEIWDLPGGYFLAIFDQSGRVVWDVQIKAPASSYDPYGTLSSNPIYKVFGDSNNNDQFYIIGGFPEGTVLNRRGDKVEKKGHYLICYSRNGDVKEIIRLIDSPTGRPDQLEIMSVNVLPVIDPKTKKHEYIVNFFAWEDQSHCLKFFPDQAGKTIEVCQPTSTNFGSTAVMIRFDSDWNIDWIRRFYGGKLDGILEVNIGSMSKISDDQFVVSVGYQGTRSLFTIENDMLVEVLNVDISARMSDLLLMNSEDGSIVHAKTVGQVYEGGPLGRWGMSVGSPAVLGNKIYLTHEFTPIEGSTGPYSLHAYSLDMSVHHWSQFPIDGIYTTPVLIGIKRWGNFLLGLTEPTYGLNFNKLILMDPNGTVMDQISFHSSDSYGLALNMESYENSNTIILHGFYKGTISPESIAHPTQIISNIDPLSIKDSRGGILFQMEVLTR